MSTTIFTHHLKLTPKLEKYVETKAGKLDRYMPNLAEVRVDLSEQNASNILDRQIAQITIRDTRGTILRAEERSNDIFAAVDGVLDKIYKQIRRYRGKRRAKRRRGSKEDIIIAVEPLPLADDGSEEATEGRIVREKRFAMNPMNKEEAIDQMELLDHDFFVFFDVKDEGIKIMYRRRDGDYGLLMPDLA